LVHVLAEMCAQAVAKAGCAFVVGRLTNQHDKVFAGCSAKMPLELARVSRRTISFRMGNSLARVEIAQIDTEDSRYVFFARSPLAKRFGVHLRIAISSLRRRNSFFASTGPILSFPLMNG
ncbi:MAG: hypothetical protein V4734_02840, partial [Terriglobus sp.]